MLQMCSICHKTAAVGIKCYSGLSPLKRKMSGTWLTADILGGKCTFMLGGVSAAMCLHSLFTDGLLTQSKWVAITKIVQVEIFILAHWTEAAPENNR